MVHQKEIIYQTFLIVNFFGCNIIECNYDDIWFFRGKIFMETKSWGWPVPLGTKYLWKRKQKKEQESRRDDIFKPKTTNHGKHIHINGFLFWIICRPYGTLGPRVYLFSINIPSLTGPGWCNKRKSFIRHSCQFFWMKYCWMQLWRL